ncbi:hypothetical protein GFC29_3716 [Anoxybacillus sp. B7M1]|nr:hypothetical protein GFC28_1718 [Anoxybacillus sp. B2M1]ANB62904.1 hypothetical protein GFC29_3716 [Anoxybacillus sp. B7M1]MBB3854043.1 hypothetical protein [Parageobacillus caldoxylosilyticus]MBB3907397.1 hypothetical protein [Anoxybacillus rupiensis]
MAMAWYDVYKDFYTLPKKEQLELFRAIKQNLFPKPKGDIPKWLEKFGKLVFLKD